MTRLSVDLPSLGELSTIVAENNADRLAFADDTGASVTWGEFERRSETAADAFANYVKPGDRVALLCESTVDTTVLWNGALKAGATVSYVHTQASPERTRYFIDELRPSVLVVSERFTEFLADRVWEQLESDPLVVVIGDAPREYERSYASFVEDAEPTAPDVIHEEDDIAVIAWTSGTTGEPKGWCHTHRSILLKTMTRGLERTSTRLSATSTSFMAWYGGTVSSLVAGATTVFISDWSPSHWAEMVEKHGATHTGMVPTMWRSVLKLDLDEYDLSSIRKISFVGEKMDESTLTELRERICPDVTNSYSSTEFTISTMEPAELTADRIESVGKPDVGTRVRIVEPGGDPDDRLGPNETGEIIVKGADCPVWAWGESDRMDEEFTDGWWYSGDLGYTDEDGYLYLEGRADFMIKSKGVKVFPGPIEERLNNHPGVDEVAVVGLDDEEYGQKVTAVVKPSDPDVTEAELDEWCLESDSVARIERPRTYVFTDSEIPRTSSQKLDRNSVIERLETGQLRDR